MTATAESDSGGRATISATCPFYLDESRATFTASGSVSVDWEDTETVVWECYLRASVS